MPKEADKLFTEEEMGTTKFMPSSHENADGVKIVPAEMETPTKASPVEYSPLKERLHASKPWKPKGRK